MFSRDIRVLFEYIYPSEENLKVFVDRVRNLLILCATEVDTQLKEVLKANGRTKKIYNIGDFKDLDQLLGLSEYRVKLVAFPKLKERRPFELFPAQTPSWWDAYNAAKHDRENSMPEATLEAMIDAFCAVAVVIKAQYGNGGDRHPTDHGILKSMVEVNRWSSSRLPFYFSRKDGVWTAKKYFTT